MTFDFSAWRERRVQTKLRKYGEWHDWFAWYPVQTGRSRWVWLRRVYRRVTVFRWTRGVWLDWEYAESER